MVAAVLGYSIYFAAAVHVHEATQQATCRQSQSLHARSPSSDNINIFQIAAQIPIDTHVASGSDLCSTLNPSIETQFADPSIVYHNGILYTFATNNVGAEIEDFNVQLATSSDNETFELQYYQILPDLPSWSSGRQVWAPDVSKLDTGKFIMYFSIKLASSPRHHCVGAAIADEVVGPYTPQDDPLICPDPDIQGGAIDASAFIDPYTGKRYITYKVDGNSLGQGGLYSNTVAPVRSTPLMIQEVEDDGITLIGAPTQLLDRDTSDGPLVEAPSLVRSQEGIYFLFYSSHCFSTPAYTVRYATSMTVTGPYTRASHPFLATSSDRNNLVGPGSLHILPSTDSDDHLIAFHGHMTLNNSPEFRARFAQTAATGSELPLVRGLYVATARLHGREASLIIAKHDSNCRDSTNTVNKNDDYHRDWSGVRAQKSEARRQRGFASGLFVATIVFTVIARVNVVV